ncbi:hypothetical protein [Enterococcus rivorum]|uniref:DUF5067 domain-containing protein n=1 Tax=Enterococcus rivorum TaxID=762845 RepID=A0A1E5KWJ7_9ENTE|nr:hypothetical protein [Enterococcus rivorum]MBP2099114.1 hypothetical protein [Enterococcus rivorum]OEH82265.1 hypothetical protein BCR26_13525 [Enterococcus rivorum]
MILKKIKTVIISLSLLFMVSGCTLKSSNDTQNTSDSVIQKSTKNYTKTINKYDGYDLNGYKFYIMDGQKEHDEFLETLSTDFDETIKQNFETYRYKIDENKKINLIPFRFRINVNQETVTTNYFIVNNSNRVVNDISFKGFPRFKNTEVEEKTDAKLTKKELGYLPEKSFVAFSITMSAPKSYQAKLKENKVADLSFDITDLEINGEKVDNNNEH